MQYIAMLQQQGPQQWYWDEIRQTKEVSFRYQEDTSASNLVTELADQMAVRLLMNHTYVESDLNAAVHVTELSSGGGLVFSLYLERLPA